MRKQVEVGGFPRHVRGSRYCYRVLATDLLKVAEVARIGALGDIDARSQNVLGQFFTPPGAARLIASMVELPTRGRLRILDPGAGSGMLTAALVSRVLAERRELSAHIVAVERDTAMLPHLRATLAACEQAGAGRVSTVAVAADFILDSIGIEATTDDGEFDVVIENPPYGKLPLTSVHRRALRADGIDTPNLYAAFLARSIEALRPGGQLVAITPRSFFNGPYFGTFRAHFLASIALRRIHVFDSRSTVFADTGVLQENVVFSGTRGAAPTWVELSASHDHTDAVTSRLVPYDDVVFPNDPNQFIRLSTNVADTNAAEIVLAQPHTLADLGVHVSTGRVVDYRSRRSLSDEPVPAGIPLVYPGNLRGGRVTWPQSIRKPQWFQPSTDKEHAMVFPEGSYTVVKRFSAKEERRRIVASVWSPRANPGPVAFENHLNVLHSDGEGLNGDLATGIAVWLNSSVIDRFFRTFSGHTQVNATDLRTLRFPAIETLRFLGSSPVTSQSEVDALVREAIPG